MTRTRIAAALIALLVVPSACTGDGEPAGEAARTDPPAGTPTDVGTARTPAGDPVRWGSSGSSCIEFSGPTVIWEWIRVSRPLTLDGVTPVGLEGGFEPGRTWIVAVPPGEVPFTGSVAGARIPERYADDVAWDDREPVRGFVADRGRYYVFVQAEVTGDAAYGGFDLTWTDETGAEGTSTWDVQDRYRSTCGR